MSITRCQPDATTEHQRIGGVTRIVINRTIHSRDTHFIAIILNPAHHPGSDPAWMQDTVREGIGGLILRAKTEDISRSNWFGGDPDYIANHTTNTGVGAPKRLNG